MRRMALTVRGHVGAVGVVRTTDLANKPDAASVVLRVAK
jgi:hypothetical protein